MATLNLQVGANADDGNGGPLSDVVSDDFLGLSVGNPGVEAFSAWARFTGVSGLQLATINSATYEVYGGGLA